MQSLIFIGALLLFVGAQGRNVRYRTCGDYMEDCARPLMRYGSMMEDDDIAAELANEETIDEMCSHVTNFTTCAYGAGQSCDDDDMSTLEPMLDGAVEIIEFMCSPPGRSLLREIAVSPCATDNSLIEDLGVEFESCFEMFQYQTSMAMVAAMRDNDENPMARVCPLVDGFRECNVEASRFTCGDAFATLVGRVWDTFSSFVLSEFGLNCDVIDQQRVGFATNMVRRALSMMKRRV